MAKKDPWCLEAALDATIGDPLRLKTAEDCDTAAQKLAAKISEFREYISGLEYRRNEALAAFDGATCTGIDERLLVVRKVVPDLEAIARTVRQRGEEFHVAEAVKAAPGLLRALAPLADALGKAIGAETEAAKALDLHASRCRSAWSLIPRDDLPAMSDTDKALVARVNVLLGGRPATARGYEHVGGITRFELPSRPRDPGEIHTVTMERPERERTVNVRDGRGRGGVG